MWVGLILPPVAFQVMSIVEVVGFSLGVCRPVHVVDAVGLTERVTTRAETGVTGPLNTVPVQASFTVERVVRDPTPAVSLNGGLTVRGARGGRAALDLAVRGDGRLLGRRRRSRHRADRGSDEDEGGRSRHDASDHCAPHNSPPVAPSATGGCADPPSARNVTPGLSASDVHARDAHGFLTVRRGGFAPDLQGVGHLVTARRASLNEPVAPGGGA